MVDVEVTAGSDFIAAFQTVVYGEGAPVNQALLERRNRVALPTLRTPRLEQATNDPTPTSLELLALTFAWSAAGEVLEQAVTR